MSPRSSSRHLSSSACAAISRARELLAALTVSQYLAERQASTTRRHPHAHAIAVDPSDTLGDILRLLAKHRILSAPVIERASGRYHGFVDVAEILGAFVASCRRWLAREYATSHGGDSPALPQNAAKETLGVYAGALREEGYAMASEAALLDQLRSTMGEGMFRKSLRASRADAPAARRGDGEAVYRGYLQASLLAVISAAFLHPITERRLMPPSIAGALACNHRVGVYDFDPAFDDGSRVADPKSFEIVSQSDLVRFLHDRRDDERIRGFLQLTAREVGFLGGRARERAREAGHARTARDARETRDARESRDAILSSSSSSSSPRPSPTPGSPPPAPALRPGIPLPPVLPYRGVLCVPDEETSALDAFALMDAEGVSALGVCDDAYRIVANVSVSDLRGLTPDTVDRLALPIVEFLRVQRGDAQGGSGYGDVRVVSCGVDDTVGRVVELLVGYGIHHAYVCSSDGHPLAMVTPNDILALLADRLVEG